MNEILFKLLGELTIWIKHTLSATGLWKRIVEIEFGFGAFSLVVDPPSCPIPLLDLNIDQSKYAISRGDNHETFHWTMLFANKRAAPLGLPYIFIELCISVQCSWSGKFKHWSILNYRFRNSELKQQFHWQLRKGLNVAYKTYCVYNVYGIIIFMVMIDMMHFHDHSLLLLRR